MAEKQRTTVRPETFQAFWRRQGSKRATKMAAAREAWLVQQQRVNDCVQEIKHLKERLRAAEQNRQPVLGV